MERWRQEALGAVCDALADPDKRPRYRIPARRWWQFWKPRWEWIEGMSLNDGKRIVSTLARSLR